MTNSPVKLMSIFLGGVASGIAISTLPAAIAASDVEPDLSHRVFNVFLDEVKQTFVFGDQFAGSYTKNVTLSDGSVRTVQLTPMIHNGMQVVEINDNGHISYTSLIGGSATNGNLMIRVIDDAAMKRSLRDQGWKFPQ